MEYKKCMKSSKKPATLCKRGYCTAKSKFKVYPSAYANGYAAQVCAGKKPDFNGKRKKDYAGKRGLRRANYRVGIKKIGLMYARRTKRGTIWNVEDLLQN